MFLLCLEGARAVESRDLLGRKEREGGGEERKSETGDLSVSPVKKKQADNMRRNVLLLLVALVAAVGAALFYSPTFAAARALLDWEDDLRPR